MSENDMSCRDILTNVISDVIFIILIALVLSLVSLTLRCGHLGKANRFFGLHKSVPLKIYISGFEHSGIKTKMVVNAVEYEAAVEIRNLIKHITGGGVLGAIANFLAGLIGQDNHLPESEIAISPLTEVNEPPYRGSMILVGGPTSNRVSQFYLEHGSPIFKFDQTTEKYLKRGTNGYQPIQSSNEVAVLEKLVSGDQTIILVHGYGEDETRHAAQHLVSHWKQLYKELGNERFGIRV